MDVTLELSVRSTDNLKSVNINRSLRVPDTRDTFLTKEERNANRNGKMHPDRVSGIPIGFVTA